MFLWRSTIYQARTQGGSGGVRRPPPNSQKYTTKVHVCLHKQNPRQLYHAIMILNTQHDQHQLTNFGQQVRLLLKLHLIWSVDSEENQGKGCHQRSDFMAKMHQIRFRLGFRPRPRWGSSQHSPDPLAGFKGPTSKGCLLYTSPSPRD